MFYKYDEAYNCVNVYNNRNESSYEESSFSSAGVRAWKKSNSFLLFLRSRSVIHTHTHRLIHT